MKLASQLLEAGVFAGATLDADHKGQLEKLFQFDDRRSLPLNSPHELTISVEGGTFTISDEHGFLAATRSFEGLMILLLMSEDARGARGTLFPGQIKEVPPEPKPTTSLDGKLAEFQARAARMREAALERRAEGPVGQAGSGDEIGQVAKGQAVLTLGLGDGPPRIGG